MVSTELGVVENKRVVSVKVEHETVDVKHFLINTIFHIRNSLEEDINMHVEDIKYNPADLTGR